MACITGSQTVDTGQFELPIRQPEPVLIKTGRNVDAAQTTYTDPVYGNQDDDVIWQVNVRNAGQASMEALRINDSITGNFTISHICPDEGSAETLAFSNGVTVGAGCIAMTTPFDVDDPFGNATDPDDIGASTTSANIYYVGRVLTTHTNETNNADLSWGCDATSPAGGLIVSPATTGGSPPPVTISDTGTLSTTVVPNSLLVAQSVTGSNPSQPLGTKGLMTITLNNQTGGSVKNITVDATLPAGYVMDNSYGPGNGTVFGDLNYGQPNHTENPAYGATVRWFY